MFIKKNNNRKKNNILLILILWEKDQKFKFKRYKVNQLSDSVI